jgi:type IV fimbrial biogenesis protein FimT
MNKDGFSLLELVVTIAILAIVAAIAIPGFARWLPDYRLRSAARDLFSNFQLAKLTAVKHNSNCTITFDGQPIGTKFYDYVVFVDTDNDMEYDAGEEVVTKVLWTDYEGVRFDETKSGGDGIDFTNNDDTLPSIAFRPNGLPRNNAGAAGSGTVYLINSRNTRRSVTVSPAGNITIQE